jgi:protocatechuate 3,4-dioxygenase beta subunit
MNRLLPLLLVVLLVALGVFFLFDDPATSDVNGDGAGTGEGTELVDGLDGNGGSGEEATLEGGAASDAISRAELNGQDGRGALANNEAQQSQIDVRLLDSHGKPIEDATVTVTERGESGRFGFLMTAPGVQRDKPYSASARSDKDGHAQLRVNSGMTFKVEAHGEFFAPVTTEIAALTAGEEVDLGTLTLTSGDRLVGRVLDPKGKPVAGAVVRLAESGSSMMRGSTVSRKAKTDENGDYIIDGLPTGEYRVRAQSSGFLADEVNPLSVSGTGKKVEADFRLSEGRVIEGTVVDLDGQPIEGAWVAPQMRFDNMDMGFDLDDFAFTEGDDSQEDTNPGWPGSVLTDAQGRFKLGGLEDLDVSLIIGADGYSITRSAVPSVGEEVLVRLTPRLSLSGNLALVNGDPAAGVEVILKASSMDGMDFSFGMLDGHRVKTEPNGDFTFKNLSAGSYTLSAFKTDAQLDETEVQVLEVVTGLNLVMQAAEHLIVQVQSADGKALPDAKVSAKAPGNGNQFGSMTISMSSDGGHTESFVGGDEAVDAKTDVEGVAILPGVPEGDRALVVEADGYADGTLDFVRNNGEQRLEMTLQPAATLRATVKSTSGRLLSGVEVYLKPQFEGGKELKQKSGAAGRAVWTDLKPGLYEVGYRESESEMMGLVMIGGEEQAQDGDGNHKVSTVELVGRSTLKMEIVVDDMALPRVEVSRNGSPAGGVQVWLESDNPMAAMMGGLGGEKPVVTGADGVALLSPREPGTYTLVARAGNNAPQVRKEVTVHSGDESLTIEVLGGEVSGTLFANGNPIVGASVTLSTVAEEGQGQQRQMRVGFVVSSGPGGGFGMDSGNPNDATAVTDSDGVYRFTDVPAGNWQVNARATGFEKWKSDSFAVRAGADVNLGSHQLLPGATISGRDLAADPSPEMGRMDMSSMVRLLDENGGNAGMTFASSDGTYSFADLAPGSYTVTRGSFTSEPLELSSGQQLTFNIPKE